MTNRNAVAQLYTPIYDEFMLATYAQDKQVSPELFEQIDDSTKEYKVDDLSGLGIWVSVEEAESGGNEDPTLGYVKTYTQGKFRKQFSCSFESVDQDEYALLKKVGEAKGMGRGSRARIETDTSTILIGGFATNGPDGVPLYDTDHPKNREETGTLYDNLLEGALSHDNLETAETQIADNYYDPAGIMIENVEDPCLVYPPALRGTVKRLLSDRALEQPGTTLRNINRFAGRYKPVEWKYLSAGNGGSDTAWHIIFKEMDMLKTVWSDRPHFTSWIDDDLELYVFKGRMLYDTGASNWRFGFASTGL